MNALRICRPSSERIGMFCRFGFDEESLPVAATVWLKDVCSRPSFSSTILGRASRYVELSLSSSRHDSSASTIGCASRSFSRTLASVDSSPLGVFFPGWSPSWS
jgi:hypothetical protein